MDQDLGTTPENLPENAGGTGGRIIFFVGSVGLLVATLTDSIAVLGRHAGFALIGSIELVQMAIVLIASAAMIFATLHKAHAAVHILTERLEPATVGRLARVTDLVSALLFALMALGSAILISDLWDGYERTELLLIPLRGFRILFASALALVALIFLRNALAGDRK